MLLLRFQILELNSCGHVLLCSRAATIRSITGWTALGMSRRPVYHHRVDGSASQLPFFWHVKRQCSHLDAGLVDALLNGVTSADLAGVQVRRLQLQQLSLAGRLTDCRCLLILKCKSFLHYCPSCGCLPLVPEQC